MTAATVNTSAAGLDDSEMMKMIYSELLNMKSDINRINVERNNLVYKGEYKYDNIKEKIYLINRKFKLIKNQKDRDAAIKSRDIELLSAECNDLLEYDKLRVEDYIELMNLAKMLKNYRSECEIKNLENEGII